MNKQETNYKELYVKATAERLISKYDIGLDEEFGLKREYSYGKELLQALLDEVEQDAFFDVIEEIKRQLKESGSNEV